MQDVLKRCNHLGSPEAIYDFSKIIMQKCGTNISSVISINALNTKSDVKVRPSLALFEFLDFIEIKDDEISPLYDGKRIVSLSKDEFLAELSRRIIAFLIDQGHFNINAISFNSDENSYLLKKSAFPLYTAAMRNLLIEIGGLYEIMPGVYKFIPVYETIFLQKVKEWRKKVSLEQLIKLHEENAKQGRMAEEYVLEFEKQRLLGGINASKVMQISDIDVMAGYDIVSYESNESKSVDRYIEVKSFKGGVHFFWSENEFEVAKILRERYYLYLVDIEKYTSIEYEPIIIQDPAVRMFNSQEWLVETSNYRITKV